MKKPTTSDKLKLVFQVALESDPADWKREARSKNEEGQTIREFRNKKTGETVTVTEMEDGYYNLKGKGLEANVRLPEQFSGAAGPTKRISATIIETDPAANAAADKAIAIIMNEEPAEDDDNDDAPWGVPQSLLDTAGKALANRHVFALMGEEEGGGDVPMAMITPLRFYQEEGHVSDQSGPISHLLPRAAEAMESTWEIYEKGIKTPVEAAEYLQSLGFQWSRDMQNFIDASLTKELEARIQAVEDVTPKASVVDEIMDIALNGKKDVPQSLLEQADRKELASRLTFSVIDEPDMGGVMAIVTPKGRDADDSKKAYDIMTFLFPKAEYIDDSVYGMWALEGVENRAKLGRVLADAGMEWEADNKEEVLAITARKPSSKKPKAKL